MYKNHKIYVLKIKVSELEFEVIPIIQNSLSQTHHQLESLSTPPYNNDHFLYQLFSVMTKGERKRKYDK